MNPPPALPEMDRAATLAALRARVQAIERGGAAAALARAGGAVSLAPAIDAALPWGGLARAGVHEVIGVESGAATGFAALVMARTGGDVLWIAEAQEAWPPGLARFGLRPENLVFVQAPSPQDGLWAMEEALRCPAVSGALLEAAAIDLVAARRLQLAAEAGGALGLLLRPQEAGVAGAGPAAALTRWRVGPIPGTGAAHDLGDPGWRLELLRCRGGRPGMWETRWRASLDQLAVAEDDIASYSHL